MGTDLGGAVDIVQTTSYYPFGLVMKQYNGNTASGYNKNKYLYNGKEIQDDKMLSEALNWYDYGARFYDPQIGRWTTPDPLSEVNRKWSPYRYAYDNPLRFIDPDGMSEGDPNKQKAQKEIVKGAGNMLFGTVGAVASGVYISGTAGAGAALGGTTAMVFSLGEIGVGMAQVTDGIKSLKSNAGTNNALEKSNTLPGLVANSAGLENADLIDAVAGVIPGALSGGNINTVLNAPEAIKDSKSVGEAIFNTLDAADAASDVVNVVTTVAGTENNTTSSNSNNQTFTPVKLPEVTPIDNTRIVTKRLNQE